MLKQFFVLLFFITTVFIFSACGPVMSVSLVITPVTVTATPSWTPSPQLIATSTITLTPHPIVTATPPSVPIPTLLSATPLPTPGNYHLVKWTPEKAEALIRLMENYPETLSYIEQGYQGDNYRSAFYYATQAGYEGLLRFSDDPRARNWRWWLGKDLMESSQYTNKGKPSKYFAGLVLASLDSKEVTIEELPTWISANISPGASTSLICLEPPQGFLDSCVLQINSIVLWLLKTQTGFQVHPLMDDFYYYFHRIETKDFTGDGIPEVVVSMSRDTNFVGSVSAIYVFDLSHMPFRQLFFGSTQSDNLGWIGFDWSIVNPADGRELIQIENDYLVGCPVHRMETYRWNGLWFELTEVQFKFDLENVANIRMCDQLTPGSSFLDAKPKETIPILETLYPYWPVPDDYYFMAREPYPKDELRFRLGVLHALNGDLNKATESLTDVIDHPTDVRSVWIARAKLFLGKYTATYQLYRACVTTILCNARFVIEQTVEKMNVSDFPFVLEKLKNLGVPIKSSALLDFNQDNSPGYWFTVLHPNRTDIEFWIVTQTQNGLNAQYVDTVTSYSPLIKLFTNAKSDTLFQIGNQKLFNLEISPNGQSIISEYEMPEKIFPDALVRQTFDKLRESLYAGQDPAEITAGLLALQKNRDFKCNLDYEHFRYADWQFPDYCPDFFYTLGLSYELSNENESAAHLYWQIWHDYPKSPYALMARFKLEPNP